MLEEISLNYINSISNPQNINEKIFNENLFKLIMLLCLITHTILNNAGNDRSIHYDSPTDEQYEIQGKILATCLKLIQFDSSFFNPNVFFFS